jgi:hypothetical protein
VEGMVADMFVETKGLQRFRWKSDRWMENGRIVNKETVFMTLGYGLGKDTKLKNEKADISYKFHLGIFVVCGNLWNSLCKIGKKIVSRLL